jgi:uncharacterized protein YdeI (BOF family)
MNRKIRPFTRLTSLATIALTLVLVTAGHAAAMRPDPAPTDPAGGYKGPSGASELVVTNSSVSALQWVLFAVALIGALLVGAALMRLSQRHRVLLAH